MTQKEFYDLYDKIGDVLYGNVHGDKGDGDDWVEYWTIDDKGTYHKCLSIRNHFGNL